MRLSQRFDTLLDKIDTYYADKSKKDIIYTYIMAGGIFIFISWAFLIDMTEAGYKKAKQQRNALLQKIEADQTYLRNFDETALQALQTQTQQLKKTFVAINETSTYIDYKIHQLEPLIYSETAWGKFLDSISDIATKNRVKLLQLSNEFVSKGNEFGHVLNIDIDFSGNFHNTLRFINALERTDLVVDVYELTMMSTNRLKTHLKVAVWGISY